MANSQSSRPFADAVASYALAGWPCILPVPPETKSPPPEGYTGAHGADTPPEVLAAWIGAHAPGCRTSGRGSCEAHDRAAYSIALRLPPGVIGIDVDQYPKGNTFKRGAETLAAAQARWGQLPPTWTSTARGGPDGPGLSRIAFYRVPSGRYATALSSLGLGPDVEIIQHHHRYAVVAPSWHADAVPPGSDVAGAPYRWYDPSGQPVELPDQRAPGNVPKLVELAELPLAWVEGLAAGAAGSSAPAAGVDAGARMLGAIGQDQRQPCAEVHSAALTALAALADDAPGVLPGSRHDTMTPRVHHLVHLGASGHPGVGAALFELHARWETVTAGEYRPGEFERMCLTSARKAVTAVGRTEPVGTDPCAFGAGLSWKAPAPQDNRPGRPDDDMVPPALTADPIWHPRLVIGAHAFDPNGLSDQTMAAAVLDRVQPAVRFAHDAGVWLLRGPDRWAVRPELAEWAVSELAWLMPRGNAKAEPGSPDRDRAARRATFMGSGGSSRIARKMRALVSAGWHPAALALAELDTQPEWLWAGGVPWDLRASLHGPVPAAGDPAELSAVPHLQSASVTPLSAGTEPLTPLWDDFCAAVWPDPEVRAWALRVLSVALTGYSDRVLPILLGLTGRGKTQVVVLLMSLLGTYAHAADPRLLGAADQSHPTIVYDLMGRRLSFIDEGPRSGKWAVERLKQITGGAALNAHRMKQDPVEFNPTHTLVLTANGEPHLTDPALRARVRLIPCDGDPEAVRLARQAIGHVRSPAWRAEAPGVLARLITQAAHWLHDPHSASVLAAPVAIRGLADEIAAEQDVIGTWCAEETTPDPDWVAGRERWEGTPARTLYQAFVDSTRRGGLQAHLLPSVTEWGRRLTDLGYPPRSTRTGKVRPLKINHSGWGPIHPVPQTDGTAALLAELGQVPTGQLDGVESKGPVDGLHVSGSVTSWQDHVTSRDQLESQLVTQETPSSEPVLQDPVDSVTSCLRPTGISQPIHSVHTKISRHGSLPLQPPRGDHENTRSELGEQPVTSRKNKLVTGAKQVTEPAPGQIDPVTAALSPSVLMPVVTETAAPGRAAAAAARRAARFAEHAGPRVPLPALVERPAPGSTEPALAQAVDLAQARAIVLAESAKWRELTVDVETSGYPVGHRDYALRTIQLGGVTAAVDFDASDAAQLALVRELLALAPWLSAHSAQADIIPLVIAELIGEDTAWDKMRDTVVRAKLTDPALTGSDPKLKKIASAMLGANALSSAAEAAKDALFRAGGWLKDTAVTTPVERSGWAMVPTDAATMIMYACADVLDTAAVSQALPEPEPALHARERRVQRVTARVTLTGLPLAPATVGQLRDEHRAALDTAGQLVRAAGVDNPGSDAQVSAALQDRGAVLPRTAPSQRFPGGQASVAKDALEPLRRAGGAVGQLVQQILTYRHHETLLSTYLEPFHRLCTSGDGRVRPTIYTLQADTGRMSCVRPNAQNIPRQGGIRACITADPGYVLIRADLASIEIRCMAALSQDPVLIRLLTDGRTMCPARETEHDRKRCGWCGGDLHSVIANHVFGPEYAKEDRYTVKRGVFGWAYGGGIPTLAAQVGVSEAIMAAVVEVLASVAPRYVEWAEEIKAGVRQGRTSMPTYSGRTIYLARKQPHKGPNFCVQGTARELLVDALLKWDDGPYAGGPVIPVHDEVLAMVREQDAVDATDYLVQCMTGNLYGIPILAEAGEPSFVWADAS